MATIKTEETLWDYKDNRRSDTPAIGEGYYVRLPELTDAAKGAYNARLVTVDFKTQKPVYIPLHVFEVEMGFSMGGSKAVSKRVTTFFPRNFQQAVITIRGQCPNQLEYGRLAEFIRYTMIIATLDAEVCQFNLYAGGLGAPFGDPLSDINPTATARKNGTKGAHQRIEAKGYILGIQRGAKFGEFAPSYEFQFTVSQMLTGLYKDDEVIPRRLRSWTEIIDSILNRGGGPGFVINPDQTGIGPGAQ